MYFVNAVRFRIVKYLHVFTSEVSFLDFINGFRVNASFAFAIIFALNRQTKCVLLFINMRPNESIIIGRFSVGMASPGKNSQL